MCWALLQLVSCMQIILVTLLYANWVLLNTVPKLLEGTCCWLCHGLWLDMLDVAHLLIFIWSGEYHSAVIYYCCNSVIKSICRVRRIHTMIFYKQQLTYPEVRGLSYHPVICELGNPVLCEQFGMQLPQLSQPLHCYSPRLITKVSSIIL